MKRSLAEFLKVHTEMLARSITRKYSSESKHIVHVLGGKSIRKSDLFNILEKTAQASAEVVSDDEAEELFIMHLHCVSLKNYV